MPARPDLVAEHEVRFEDLEQHRRELTGYCYRMLGSGFEAEDAVQETMVRAWRGIDGFEGRSAVGTWIMSIARFKALSARRRRQDAELDDKVAETVADEAHTPEEAMLSMDRSEQLRECLKQLSPEHREIVDLVYYHDKTIEEVAEIIQVPKNTVKTRMFYARKRLAQLLASHKDFDHLTVAA